MRKEVWLLTGRDEFQGFVEKLLGAHGFDVRRFSDGAGSLAALGRGDLPDLMVADDPPPGMSRAALQARIQEMAPSIRCLFLRDSEESVSPEETGRFATDAFTLNSQELLELIEKLISESGSEVSPGSIALEPPTDAKKSLLTTVGTFVSILERYEFLNGGNGALVQRYAIEVAQELGLPGSRIEAIAAASLLYDIGMLRIRPEVKLKVAMLTPEEIGAIREHPRLSAEFCDSLKLPWDIRRAVLHHHERYDGRGYPDGLVGRSIPIDARILGVGDAYFAMIGKRPNREPVSEEEALRELTRQAGLQFDPEVVEIWTSLIQANFLGEQGEGVIERPKRIALIDDDRELRVLLELKFSALGYEVLPVIDPQRVLPTILESMPEAVIVNVDLPWIDGYQLLHRVRQEAALGGVPFIFLSAVQTTASDRTRAAAAGADDYIVRPSPLQELVSRVNGAIRRKRRLTGQHFVRPPFAAGIRGRLSEMELAEICQILAQGFKTAKVSVVDTRAEGQLFFEEGKLKHVSFAGLEGADAFYALLRLREGEFAIEHGVAAPTETVTERLEFLLMEGMRLMDEEKRGEA